MTTARELLAQADALMRRNRSEPADDFPVLTDAVPVLPEAPAADPAPVDDVHAEDVDDDVVDAQDVDAQDVDAQDVDAQDVDAQDVDAQDVDAQDVEAQDVEAQDVEAQDVEAQDVDTDGVKAEVFDADGVDAEDVDPDDLGDSVPTLTDEVMIEDLEDDRVGIAEAPVELVDASDDSIADELEPLAAETGSEHKTATSEAFNAEGEPSDWLAFDDGNPSVIGDVPDSIAIVPPVGVRPRSADALGESADVEDIELTSAPGEGIDQAFDDDLGVPPARTPSETSAPEVGADDAEAVDGEDRTDLQTEPQPELAPELVAAAGTASTLRAAFEATRLLPEDLRKPLVDPSASQAMGYPTGAEARRDPFAASQPEPSPVAAALAGATPAIAAPIAAPIAPTPEQLAADAAREEARWDAMAEEIRMQVLQRIDLFTDTGLRTQLGARLQPIVDRASADLVATINQHVGELLRAYVAEAIEREIEVWRRDN